MKYFWMILFVAPMLLSVQVWAGNPEAIQLMRFAKNVNLATAEKIIHEAGFEIRFHHPPTNIFSVSPGDNKDIDILRLKSAPEVLYVQANGSRSIDQTVEKKSVNKEAIESALRPLLTPNDSLYDQQRGMRAFGAERAWDVATGSRDIVVAVSDTGVSLNHVDLRDNLWRNPGEVPDNGIDDDNNGYIDDVHGWDWANDDNDPDDDNRHGSHVAGIIGGVGNNGRGIAGVNWRVQIMALKFLSGGGSGTDENGTKTILYAADNGARVINASWGGQGENQAMTDAIRYAASKGVLFVAAAGNASANNETAKFFPANTVSPNVVAVGATTNSHAKAEFSNYGSTKVHVFAPGVKITSTHKGTSSYIELSGTSMASPMVAGAAALILSRFPRRNMVELRNAIYNSAISRTSLARRAATGGHASAEKALVQMLGTNMVWPHQMRLKAGQPFQFTAYNFPGPVTWASSNTEVATINSSGFLTGHKNGTIQVTATAAGGVSTTTGTIEITGGGSGGGGGGCNAEVDGEDPVEGSMGFAFLLMLPLMMFGLLRKPS